MIVIVRDIVNDTERAYHGSEQVVENALRVAYPFLTACVQLGDMDTLLYEIGRSYGKLVEVPEGQALDPLMHLPMRFDCEPHECKTGCPLFNGISKREQWLNELDAYVLEKSVFDLKPGEETQPIQEDPDSHHSAVFYDYSHLLHPGVINKPGHRYHGQRYGDVFRVHLFERPNPSGNGWYLRAKLLEHPFDKYNEVGYVSGIQYPKRKGVPEKHLNVGMAEINHEHRGLGLGAALYESFYAHGAHYHGATHIAGGVHSTMAHKTHQRLSDKHGLEYYAQPNEGSTEARDFGQGEFDSAYGPYEYTIKAESPFTEAAFRNKHSGEVCGTQFFHNIDLIPPSWGVDEDHVEHIEAGFLDHTGRFYTRQEAADRLKQAAPLQSEDLRQQGLGRPEGHEHLGGGAGMVKMAIADIRPGTERPSSDTTLKNYDYSHVLSPLFKRSYRISIRERVNTNPKFYSVVMQAKNKKPTAKWDGHIFASVHDNNGPKHVIVEDSFLHPDHRGKGLGLALYEAALAHAKHVHEVAEVRGGYHSTSAHNVHKRLSEKHGMRYEAPTTAGDMYDPDDYFKSPPRAYDAKYGHYKYTLKSEDDSLFALANNLNTAGDTVEEAGEVAGEMAGFAPRVHGAFDAARFMVGGESLSLDQIRRALWLEDGDYEAAALRAYDLEPDQKNIRALRAVMKLNSMRKTENLTSTPRIEAPVQRSLTAASEVQRGFQAGLVQHVNLNGKYSRGSMVIRDPKSEHVYLLKPDSEKISPAMGVAEEEVSQPAREAAFWHIANLVHLDSDIPRADLINIDGQEWAAIRLLPFNYKNLEKRFKQASHEVMQPLARLLQQGTLHKWAVLDYVLGNPDRHGQNLMIGHDEKLSPVDRNVALIDHGSAFAGYSFSPANDSNSFIPFYLRAWGKTGGNFNKMRPQDKMQAMPRINHEVARTLGNWLGQFDEHRIEHTLKEYGIHPGPVLQRLAKLRMLVADGNPVDKAINQLWVGAA